MKRFLPTRSTPAHRTFTALDGNDYTWVVRHDVSPASSPPQAPVRILSRLNAYLLRSEPNFGLLQLFSFFPFTQLDLLTQMLFFSLHVAVTPSSWSFVPDLCLFL